MATSIPYYAPTRRRQSVSNPSVVPEQSRGPAWRRRRLSGLPKRRDRGSGSQSALRPEHIISARLLLAAVCTFVLVAISSVPTTYAQSAPTITDDGVDARFPDHLVFRASAQGGAMIQKILLRYQILPDGTLATGEAKFDAADGASATFALQSSDQPTLYLPPGTTIKYHWEVIDTVGGTSRTDEATFFYDDTRFHWSPISQGGVTIYYYSGSEDDARKMLSAAADQIASMSKLLGANIDFPVKVWIYDSIDDMRPALPRRSATFENSVITLGTRVATDTVLVLGEVSFDTLRHELTHVVTARAGESGLSSLPAWLDEGTAVYGQSDPGGFGTAVDRAISSGDVLSVRSITSPAGDPNKVNLSYGESWSLVKYLIDTYGQAKFAQLYAEIKKGKRIDAALQAAYGFDQDGLEDKWRASKGLPPRETPTPAAEEQSKESGRPSGQNTAIDNGGTSTATLIGIALGTLALAGVIGFAGFTLARRFR